MITVRKSTDRGHAHHGWLDTYHTFSFGRYIDRNHMGFRSLRVINQDIIAGGTGFGMHPHDNMEIFTYMLDGGLTHRDSAGNQATIGPGQVQYMSAGSGIAHSEHNASKSKPAHLMQVWILPNKQDGEPRYEDKDFRESLATGELIPIVSGDGRAGSIRLEADAVVFAAKPSAGKELCHTFAAGRGGWLQLLRGSVSLNGTSLKAGDGAAIESEDTLAIKIEEDAEFLLFDLA